MSDLIVRLLRRERDGQGMVELYQDFTYWPLDGSEPIIVPRTFVSDGCTVPRIARWLIPQYGRGAEAGILHDWLLQQHDPRANDIFSEVLTVAKTPKWRHWLAVSFVRIWTV